MDWLVSYSYLKLNRLLHTLESISEMLKKLLLNYTLRPLRYCDLVRLI